MVLSLPSGLTLEQTMFKLMRSVQTTPLRGGGSVSVDYAPARWTTTIRTPAGLNRTKADPVKAFAAKLGRYRQVYMWDWLRPYPKTYPAGFGSLTRAGGGSFDGTANVTALTASTIALSTLPASFVVKAGDMIGLTEGSRRGLYTVVDDATANGSGVVTLNVEPAVESMLFTDAATANFDKPVCVMTLTDEADPNRDYWFESVEFTLVQVPA